MTTAPDTPQPPRLRPQQLSREAQRRLQAARLWIAANRPYYSKAVFSCPVIPAAPPTRISIDERWSIYANSVFLESLTVKRAAVELIHVLNHALRDHAQRARNKNVDAITAAVWNVAADCEINDDLFEDDLHEPDVVEHDVIDHDDWLFPENFGMDELMPAEHYYRHLLDNSVTVETHIECGSGCHSHHLDHELDPDVETLSDFDRTLLKRVVAAAVADHQKTCGTESVPEGLARWARADTASQSRLATATSHRAAFQRAPQNRHSRLHMAAALAPSTTTRHCAATRHDPPRSIHRRRSGHLRINGRTRTRPGTHRDQRHHRHRCTRRPASESCR